MGLNELKNQLGDREKVVAWLNHINEHDEACRAEVLEACARDREDRAYYVMRYEAECK